MAANAKIATKYKAKHVWWDDLKKRVVHPIDVEAYRCGKKLMTPKSYFRFDSQHEFKVYLELVRQYGYERIIRQYEIQIISPGICYPNGRTWRVDFAITLKTDRNNIVELYEAKGLVTREFTYILPLLEIAEPKLFNSLNIVFPNKVPLQNKVIKAMAKSVLAENLITLKDLQKQPILPWLRLRMNTTPVWWLW